MQLTDIYVNNFKALVNFKVELGKITIVAGDNASGKSSVIQAIAFLKACCTDGITFYLSDRNVTVDDLVSHLSVKINRIIEFQCIFHNGSEILQWDITFLTERTTDSIYLRSEKVTLAAGGRTQILLVFDNKLSQIYNELTEEFEEIGGGSYVASRMAYLDKKAAATRYPHLLKIVDYFLNTEPLDLLTPSEMRRSARGNTQTLGKGGEKLPALINALSEKEKNELLREVQKVLPQINSIDSVVAHGGPGWARLETTEKFKNQYVKVGSSEISDGTLRLIALFAIQYTNHSAGLTLLDEVEDGINSSNLEIFYDFVHKLSEGEDHQFLLTTHSTVLLDYAEPEMIRWIFRNEKGEARCARFDSSEKIRKKLSFLYPGEIVLNVGKDGMTAMLKEDHTDD